MHRASMVAVLAGFTLCGCGSDGGGSSDFNTNAASGATGNSATSNASTNNGSTTTGSTQSSTESTTSGSTTTGSTNTATGAGGGTNSASTTVASSASSSTGSALSPSFSGCDMFPADNPWNTDISSYPLHPNSDNFIDAIGRGTNLHPDFGTEYSGAPIGMPFTTVDASQAGINVSFTYADESDPGPYPIPPDAPIEGGGGTSGDRHVLVIETDNCILYELYGASPVNNGASWMAGSGAIWDLNSNALRPDRWTSADAAGLPVFPGLIRYDEVAEKGEITHALRFTVSQSQAGYIAPATHAASSSSDANRPPMGLRLRMKASYDCSGLDPWVQVVCTGLKRYGMFVADNGSNWYLSGTHDTRWDDDRIGDIKQIPGDAFEVVDTGPITPW